MGGKAKKGVTPFLKVTELTGNPSRKKGVSEKGGRTGEKNDLGERNHT